MIEIKLENKAVLFTSLGHFINDGVFFLFPVLTTLLSVQKSFSPWIIGILFAIYYGSSAVFTTFISVRADKTKRYGEGIAIGIALLSLGLIIFMVSLLIPPSTFLITLVVLSTIVLGVGTGYYHPLGAAVLQNVVTRNKVGKALGINGGLGSIGRAIYPAIFFGIAVLFTYSASLGFLSALGFLVALMIYFELKNIVKIDIKQKKENMGKSIKNAITKGILILSILTFARALATQGIVSWIPFYLTYTRGMGLSLSLGTTMTIIYTIAIIGQPLFGILADKFDRRYLLILSTIGSGLAVIGYVLTGGYISLLLLMIFAFFNFTGFPILMALTKDYVQSTSSLSNSLVWGIANTGGMVIGPLVVGSFLLNSYSGLVIIYEVLAVFIIIIGFFTFLLPKPSEKSKMPLFG
ncbi:MAG: MFS transporter [Thermoplasmata archaeon]